MWSAEVRRFWWVPQYMLLSRNKKNISVLFSRKMLYLELCMTEQRSLWSDRTCCAEVSLCLGIRLSLSAPFQTTLVVCYFCFNKLSISKTFISKVDHWMSNIVDPDEMAHYEPSHLDLRCLQKPIVIAYGSERVNPLLHWCGMNSRCGDLKL